jgi:hypothetical protein
MSKPVSPADFEQWLADYEPVSFKERRTGSRPFRKEA